MTVVTLYGRPGCHLCEDALQVLKRVRERRPFEFEEVDIEADAGLLTRYLERIPVVLIDGRERFELFVDEHALERALGPAVQ